MHDNRIKILMAGDIVGASGRAIFNHNIARICSESAIDLVIVNGENSAHGVGITPKIADFFFDSGVDIITSGNHIWHKKEIFPYIATHNRLLRPANFPSGVPGVGVTTIAKNGVLYAVVNLQGRVFMRETLDCPFKTLETILTFLRDKTPIIIVDFHAEATSEKQALARYFDGRISAFFGTHTHVQTSDERILPKGTAYITDIGMSGSLDGLLGMETQPITQRFLTQMPTKFAVAMQPPYCMDYGIVTIDRTSGKAVNIERFHLVENTTYDDTPNHVNDYLGGF